MIKKDITIGILDIDSQFIKSIKETFDKEGYTVMVYQDHEALVNNLKLRKIDVFIIECLTQKVTLSVLVDNILKQVENKPLFIFVSMILDKLAVRDTLLKTHSPHFFKKPINPTQIVELLNSSFEFKPEGEAVDLFNNLVHQVQSTHQERLQALQSIQTLNGNDVPRFIAVALKAQYHGAINFTSPEGKVSKVLLSKGHIIRAEVDDPKSFFGALLVDQNFVSLEEMESVLEQKSSKRIGERLVDANLISPHVIELINVEQLGIRLGYIVKNTSYDISWEEHNIQPDSNSMNQATFQRFCSEWLSSKMEFSWLKTFFLPHLNSKILKGSQFQDISPLYHLAPLSRMSKFSQEVIKGTSMIELINSKLYNEEDIYTGIYLLLTQEFIAFDRQINSENQAIDLERLRRINSEMEKQNYFEVLGLNDKAKSKEIKKAYYELSKLFHPDKISNVMPKEVKDLTQAIFSHISKANEVLGDDTKRAKYLKELEQGNAEKILESESLFDEARSYLKSSQPSKALPLIERALQLRPPTSDLRLHHLWARLQLIPNEGIAEYLKSIEADLNRIPPEDRHNSMYYFVKGLYSKVVGDFNAAEKHIKHALSITGNFIEAQRELNILELQKKSNKNVDILNADLKDVVGMLFKKKK